VERNIRLMDVTSLAVSKATGSTDEETEGAAAPTSPILDVQFKARTYYLKPESEQKPTVPDQAAQSGS